MVVTIPAKANYYTLNSEVFKSVYWLPDYSFSTAVKSFISMQSLENLYG